jgi:hypothetical protein
MYINTKRSTRNLGYFYLTIALVFIFDVFYVLSNGSSFPISLYVILPILSYLGIQGPFIFEYESSPERIVLKNKSFLLGFLSMFFKNIEIAPQQMINYKVVNRSLRPYVLIQYKTSSGEVFEDTFCIWALDKHQRKDIKASLSRFKARFKNERHYVKAI